MKNLIPASVYTIELKDLLETAEHTIGREPTDEEKSLLRHSLQQ